MNKFFFKLKKTIFGTFPNFFGQKKFSQKYWAVMHNFIRVSGTCHNSDKSNDPIPRKHTNADVRREVWPDPNS